MKKELGPETGPVNGVDTGPYDPSKDTIHYDSLEELSGGKPPAQGPVDPTTPPDTGFEGAFDQFKHPDTGPETGTYDPSTSICNGVPSVEVATGPGGNTYEETLKLNGGQCVPSSARNMLNSLKDEKGQITDAPITPEKPLDGKVPPTMPPK